MKTNKKRQWWIAAGMSVAMMTLVACSDDNDSSGNTSNELREIELTEAEEQIAVKNVDFAFNLLAKADECLDENSRILLSPMSASLGLSMVANGAAGETKQEILDALGFENLSLEAMNDYNRKLVKQLTALDKTVTISMANSVWMNGDFTTLPDFAHRLEEYYEAGCTALDFSQSGAREAINDWCADKTNGRITDMVDQLGIETRILLLNALYFKGKWKYPFDEKETGRGVFTTTSGVQQTVDFMHAQRRCLYAANEHLSMAEFSYGNDAYRLAVLLPERGVSLSDCMTGLSGTEWLALHETAGFKLLDVRLPKFELKCKENLNETLQALGMEQAFNDRLADFSNLSNESLCISTVKQSNFISINEQGAEAASVTQSGMIATDSSTAMDSPIEFHADRPFLFLIVENSTRTILFLGKIAAM
ncbi:MAG: serpin family protein [Bacteroides sp.]|nr:serpin family protein [Bacteroides sp.]